MVSALIGTGAPQYVYGYDHGSNLTSITPNGTTESFSYTSTNAITSGTYDANGSQTTVSGSASDIGYAGYFTHAASGLDFALFRAYDPAHARWLNRDPIGETGGVNLYAYARGNPVTWVDSLGLYPAIQVTLPDGTTYIPMTTIKNAQQAKAYGLNVCDRTAIAVPEGANPQQLVNAFGSVPNGDNLGFALFWRPNGPNDYKNVPGLGPMYDAYGNLEYGATGEAAGYTLSTLTGVADALHGGSNNPINTTDITSGYNAIAAGGTLNVIDYNPPALGAGHGYH